MPPALPQRLLGKTGWNVSSIAFGTWGLGGQWGVLDESMALNTIKTAIDAGINLFDAADSYGDPPGRSEVLLGKALRAARGDVYIATKVGNFGRRQGHPLPFTSPLHVRLCCEASLHRLQTDYIDLYQCHLPKETDYSIFLESFEELVADGKIRAFGISTASLRALKQFNVTERCATLMTEYNVVKQRTGSSVMPYCAANDIGVIVRSPLAMGVLSGKFAESTTFADSVRSDWNAGKGRERFLKRIAVAERIKRLETRDRSSAQIALKFALSHPAAPVVVAGATTPAQVLANVSAVDIELSEQEIQHLTLGE